MKTDIFNGNATEDVSQNIQNLKREILKVRRAIFPLREVISRIEKSDNALIDETNTYTIIVMFTTILFKSQKT